MFQFIRVEVHACVDAKTHENEDAISVLSPVFSRRLIVSFLGIL
jgi:hypothetical protein